MALLEASGNNVGGVLAAAVANMLSQGVQEQIETCRQTAIRCGQRIRVANPQVLACDALYLCAGLGAYTVKEHFDFQAWFQAFLGPALEALVATMQARALQVSGGEESGLRRSIIVGEVSGKTSISYLLHLYRGCGS
ncbi:unnamed protein product [Ectocarpus sp. CCAP 1310/34]|nr:unnamed protein product [Ectocarpus sp. CCAP 1310/34]